MELYALPWDGVMAHPYDEDCQLCDRNVRSLITRQEFHDSNRGRSQMFFSGTAARRLRQRVPAPASLPQSAQRAATLQSSSSVKAQQSDSIATASERIAMRKGYSSSAKALHGSHFCMGYEKLFDSSAQKKPYPDERLTNRAKCGII